MEDFFSKGNMMSGREDFVLILRVLGYQEDGPWAAHCLETDLVGYGDTFDEAIDELKELTDMQVSFAFFKNQPSLLDHPAPPWVLESYSLLMQSALQNFTAERKIDSERQIGSIPLPHRLDRPYSSFVQA